MTTIASIQKKILEKVEQKYKGGVTKERLARIFGMEVGVKGRTVGPERVAERVRRGVEEFGEAAFARGVGPEVREILREQGVNALARRAQLGRRLCRISPA